MKTNQAYVSDPFVTLRSLSVFVFARIACFLPGLLILMSCAGSNPEYDSLISRGEYVEAKQLIRRLLHEYSLRDWNPTMPARRAQLYYWLGNAHAKLHEYDSLQLALSLCVASDAGFAEDKERLLSEVARSEYNKAVASYNAGYYGEATTGWKSALDLLEPIESQPIQARIHRNLAYAGMAALDTPKVLYHLKQSARLGDPASNEFLQEYGRSNTSTRPITLQTLADLRSTSADSTGRQLSTGHGVSVTQDAPLATQSEAIQFHLVGGFAVSYLAPLGEQSAFRVTADLQLSARSSEGPSTYHTASFDQDMTRSTSSHLYGAEVGVSYLRSVRTTDNSSFYFGLGPDIRYTTWSSTEKRIENPNASSLGSRNEYNDRTVEWGLGVRGIAGLQARLTPTISCLAEYQISVLHTWQANSGTSLYTYSSGEETTSSTGDQKGWQLGLSSIRLGISVNL